MRTRPGATPGPNGVGPVGPRRVARRAKRCAPSPVLCRSTTCSQHHATTAHAHDRTHAPTLPRPPPTHTYTHVQLYSILSLLDPEGYPSLDDFNTRFGGAGPGQPPSVGQIKKLQVCGVVLRGFAV